MGSFEVVISSFVNCFVKYGQRRYTFVKYTWLTNMDEITARSFQYIIYYTFLKKLFKSL